MKESSKLDRLRTIDNCLELAHKLEVSRAMLAEGIGKLSAANDPLHILLTEYIQRYVKLGQVLIKKELEYD